MLKHHQRSYASQKIIRNPYFSFVVFSFRNALLLMSREVSFLGVLYCQEINACCDAANTNVLLIAMNCGSNQNDFLWRQWCLMTVGNTLFKALFAFVVTTEFVLNDWNINTTFSIILYTNTTFSIILYTNTTFSIILFVCVE